jgi:hypothetical protein
MHVHVIRTPLGPAPEHVRRTWIGLILPLAHEYPGLVEYPPGTPGLEFLQGYLVAAHTALEALAARAPRAADWFYVHMPELREPDQALFFDTSSCDLVDIRDLTDSDDSTLTPQLASLVRALLTASPPDTDRFAVALALFAAPIDSCGVSFSEVGFDPLQASAVLSRIRPRYATASFANLVTVMAAASQLAESFGHTTTSWEHALLATLRVLQVSDARLLAVSGLTEDLVLRRLEQLPRVPAVDAGALGSCRDCGHQIVASNRIRCPECGRAVL